MPFIPRTADSGGVSIATFGAIAGGQDCSAALQTCIDAVASAGGGTVFVPVGTWHYATGLVFPRSPVVNICGGNWRDSVLKYTGAGKAISFSVAAATVVDRLHWRNFFLDCGSSTATRGIELSCDADTNGFRWCRFENIVVWGAGVSGSIGWELDSVVVTQIDTCFSRGWGSGWHTSDSGIRCSQILFNNCTAQECDTGWSIENEARSLRMIQCRNEGNGSTPVTRAFHFDGAGLTNVSADHTLIGCETEDEYTDADFRFDNCHGITMIGGGPGTNATGDGIVLNNSSQCNLAGLNIRPHEASEKKAVKFTGNSVGNTVIGKYESDADTTDAQRWARIQFDSGSELNNVQLKFDGGGETPLIVRRGGLALSHSVLTGTSSVDYRSPGTFLCDASGGAFTTTLSSIGSRPYTAGARFTFKKIDSSANTVTIDGSGSETIDGATTKTLTAQWQSITIEAGATGAWYVV